LRRNQLENWIHPIETAIYSGYIDSKTLELLETIAQENVPVIKKWLAHAMVELEIDGGARLTTNGTWFTGNLVAELKECLEQKNRL
jgi:hypothetical protein